jgi:alpha-L-arabinofuranosidase
VDGWQWKPDLIWFDNLNSFGTTNYYVQQLFSVNKGTHVLDMLTENKPLTGQHGLYATAAWDGTTREIILKVVNATDTTISQEILLRTSKKLSNKGLHVILNSDEPSAMNTMEQQVVKPVEKNIDIKGKSLNLTFVPYSVNVIKIRQK